MDANGNHQLSADEFIDGLVQYGISLTKEQAEQVFAKFDKNKDGQIHFNEFL